MPRKQSVLEVGPVVEGAGGAPPRLGIGRPAMDGQQFVVGQQRQVGVGDRRDQADLRGFAPTDTLQAWSPGLQFAETPLCR